MTNRTPRPLVSQLPRSGAPLGEIVNAALDQNLAALAARVADSARFVVEAAAKAQLPGLADDRCPLALFYHVAVTLARCVFLGLSRYSTSLRCI
jgi:hypothetical protein